jgi:hypothetical protein
MDRPSCPDCEVPMIKAFIETEDHSGWQGGWVCACLKSDYERRFSGPCIFVHSKTSKVGEAVNAVFNDQ